MGIDIFLSSASRQGYSQDMVDLFAQPSGAIHQYRYASKWISDDVIGRIADGEYGKKPQGIMFFIDQATKNITPLLLPVRFATIERVREHGTTRSVQFRLGEFCKTADIAKFNEMIRSRFKELPDYVGGKVEGKYWLYDKSGLENAVQPSSKLGDWETLIEQYYEMPNPVEELPFYRFEWISDVDLDRDVKPVFQKGELAYELSGGHEYSVSIYHYHPSRDFPDVSLEIFCPDELLIPVNGNARVLHTRYDRKSYRIAVKRAMLGARTRLSFRRTERASGKLIWEDVLLRINIKPSLPYAGGYVLAVAIGFSMPFLVRAADDPKTGIVALGAALGGGVIVGVATLVKDKLRL